MSSILKRLLAAKGYSIPADLALLLLRGVVGIAFMFHGWSKIQRPFNWMGENAFAPGFLQALAALSEFGGGAALVLGLVTPLASLGIACTMVVATWTHAITRGDPFVAKGVGPSYEPALVYLCVAIVLLTLGPGRLSLDRILFGKRERHAPA